MVVAVLVGDDDDSEMVAHPEFIPDPDLSRPEMETLQRELAAVARFEDDPPIDPTTLGDRIVAGVDQAFLDDRAISAIVACRGDEVIEQTHAVSELTIPYVPGLLSFREGGPILDAFETLTVEPDLVLFDGSGRIHFRQAGLATHMGVVLDYPSIGVAKSLLCGRPRSSTEGLLEGARVAIEANHRIDAPDGTLLGYAVQTRQYASDSRYINPLYVSPGHRVGPEAAADHVAALCTDYKLPEPVRLADQAADTAKDDYRT